MNYKKHGSILFDKETFIIKSDDSFSTHYEIIKELGSGGFGHVYQVRHNISKELRACKQLLKGKIDDIELFNKEINILSQMDHPNIIKLFEIFEDQRYLYLIMEQCTGGELFERIIDNVNKDTMFTEKEAAEIFKQIMSAIAYCHSMNICHRDLKPENLLFKSNEKDSPIKIIDFGLSKSYTPSSSSKAGRKKKNSMKTKVGTAYYVSPEVLKGEYNEKCDIWSCGVILYLMLCGEPPFNGGNDSEIYYSIQKKEFTFREELWGDISKQAKSLIKKMLCDPEVRLTAQQVLDHPWLLNAINQSGGNGKPNANGNTITQCKLNIEALKEYRKISKLKKAVLTFIASRLNDNEISSLRESFESLDKNKDGTISFEELKEGLTKLKTGKIAINAEEIFKAIDTKHSGRINYTDFIAASIDQKIYLKEEKLYEAFRMFDKDNSGKISKDEIKQVLHLNNENDQIVDKLMKELDLNGDGEIDYQEFLAMMKA